MLKFVLMSRIILASIILAFSNLRTQQTRAVGMQDIKELLQKSRLLENDVDFCQTSSRPPGYQLPSALSTSTMAIFCDQQQIDPVHSSVTSVCKFHDSLVGKSLSY